MDPEGFSANFFKWDPTRGMIQTPPGSRLFETISLPPPPPPPQQQPPPQYPPPSMRAVVASLGGLEDLFQAYGIRYYTAAKIAELGFTVSTLVNMKEEEIEDMMNSLQQIFRWELLVGERYGIKAAVRAERRRLLDHEMEDSRRRSSHHHHVVMSGDTTLALDALSQEGLSEEPVQQDKEAAGSGGGGTWEVAGSGVRKKQRRKKGQTKNGEDGDHDDLDGGQEDEEDGGGGERQREHPFIVTEPGEVARGKKNGLDYLFHLYEQCREFLIQVQNIAKERGEKCPTKVTNQVFRFAKKSGASYINKPKMRHYVHCYALHCLDEEASNALRRSFKERGENVGAWRQACYRPLVSIASRQGWDIDAIFSSHPRLSIWYVPTKLRQLCHAQRNCVGAAASSSISGGGDHLPF